MADNTLTEKKVDVTFVKEFRWTLEADGFPSEFIKSVNIDWHNKRIFCEVYEVIDPTNQVMTIVQWIEQFEQHKDKLSFTFTTFDGLGKPLYKYVFSGIDYIDRFPSRFNYESSETSVSHFGISYAKYELKIDSGDVNDNPKRPEGATIVIPPLSLMGGS